MLGRKTQASLTATHCKGKFLGKTEGGSTTISKSVDVASTSP